MDATIIIGAGAAGLMAARRLSAAGQAVILLEARASAGGRIFTLSRGGDLSVVAEGGAEFIHGELPISLRLAREAGVTLQPVDSQMVQMRQGKEPDSDQREAGDWGRLMERMADPGKDRPFADFLAETFPGERYRNLRDAAGRTAEGYDLADLQRVSTHSLYREWSGESEDEEEYRLAGGYRELTGYLADVCRKQGCRFHFSTIVTEVIWRRGRVEVRTAGGAVFSGRRLVTTASLGVLKSGGIRFTPDLTRQQEAIGRLGFGSVIKVLLEFKKPFWRDRKTKGRTLFILSDEPVPTWWTQTADDCPLITGWIAGQALRDFRECSREGRRQACFDSLAHLFKRDPSWLRQELVHSVLFDWEHAPYIRGGYSFETVGGEADRAILADPVEDTLFFAGEALYDGPVPGTVEAAFSSGNSVAARISG
ncbi:MAG TPA: NAD(P)/FAD-dependent oxidoreductase [Puia sp.]|nr:NAD(P)/FAD-dependent oxidoreductase [Puia sp.]